MLQKIEFNQRLRPTRIRVDEMKKNVLLLSLCLLLVNHALAQIPSGPRPPQDTVKYVGMFDVTPNDVDYDTYVFSPTGNVAAFVGTLTNFINCLNSNLSKKTKEYFNQKQEWVILSFVVEKDSTVSDVQVWLSDDPVFSKLQHIWSLNSEIDGYPGWGKVFIAGRYHQIWKSRNRGINRDFMNFIKQTRWVPIKIDGKTVRSYRNFHLPINLKRSE